MEKLIITPKTKIYDLLEAYPELEDTLIDSAPEFKKLKNPVLRKTITRITNIGQAATIGGLNVEELVNRLREKVGQNTLEKLDDTGTKYVTECPVWFRKEAVSQTIDIREMLNKGEQPVHEVLAAIKKLNESEILEIIAPFIPAPLLDKTLSLEYKHWLDKKSDSEYLVYFSK
jgi:TusA-related sulfurtransferase